MVNNNSFYLKKGFGCGNVLMNYCFRWVRYRVLIKFKAALLFYAIIGVAYKPLTPV